MNHLPADEVSGFESKVLKVFAPATRAVPAALFAIGQTALLYLVLLLELDAVRGLPHEERASSAVLPWSVYILTVLLIQFVVPFAVCRAIRLTRVSTAYCLLFLCVAVTFWALDPLDLWRYSHGDLGSCFVAEWRHTIRC